MILPVAVQPVPEIHHLWLVVAILGLRFSKNEVHRGPTMSHHVPPKRLTGKTGIPDVAERRAGFAIDLAKPW